MKFIFHEDIFSRLFCLVYFCLVLNKTIAATSRVYPLPSNVCSTARLAARPHALRPCARQPSGCHFNSRHFFCSGFYEGREMRNEAKKKKREIFLLRLKHPLLFPPAFIVCADGDGSAHGTEHLPALCAERHPAAAAEHGRSRGIGCHGGASNCEFNVTT